MSPFPESESDACGAASARNPPPRVGVRARLTTPLTPRGGLNRAALARVASVWRGDRRRGDFPPVELLGDATEPFGERGEGAGRLGDRCLPRLLLLPLLESDLVAATAVRVLRAGAADPLPCFFVPTSLLSKLPSFATAALFATFPAPLLTVDRLWSANFGTAARASFGSSRSMSFATWRLAHHPQNSSKRIIPPPLLSHTANSAAHSSALSCNPTTAQPLPNSEASSLRSWSKSISSNLCHKLLKYTRYPKSFTNSRRSMNPSALASAALYARIRAGL